MKTTQKKPEKKSIKGVRASFIFLAVVIFLYVVLFFVQKERIVSSLRDSGALLGQIAPILVIVILFITLINYIAKPKKILYYTGKESGVKGWLIAIVTGIISHGPIYIWFPLLQELKTHGMRNGLIAAFLYNRAIKIPLLPLMIYYFNPLFVGILLFYMVVASIIEGKLVEWLIDR